YDSDNRLKEHTLPMGGKIRYAYDAAGNLLSETDAAGNTARYAYDEADRLVRMEAADGAVTTFGYDHEGNLVSETDALGHVTEYTYDDLGRRTGVMDAAGAVTGIIYNEAGNVAEIRYPNGSRTMYAYERGGRIESVLYPDGSGESYAYDAAGNMTDRTTNAGEHWHYSHDALDRITAITNPAGGEAKFTYDALGRVTKADDENGNTTCYEYTPNGNLAKVTDALGNETFYQYDAMGHLTQSSCTGANGEEPQNTTYTWDKEGHVLAVADPLGDVERYTYDPAGRMKAKVDKDGYETSFHYGKDGQVEEICYADGRTVSLTYNAIRQLEEVKDWLGTTRISMDEAGRVSSVTDPYGKTVGYEWGSMGERTAVLYPDGRKAAYEYNKVMQLTAMKLISNKEQEKTIRYCYDEAGRLTGKQFPGGNRTDYHYNGAGKVEEILHTGADFTERYHYGYDVMGNKITAEKERPGLPEDSGNFSYGYDELNRLIHVSQNGKTLRSYGYDAFGNRSSKTEYQTAGELVTTYRYNTKNQLMQETDAGGTKDYAYDHRGNLLSVTSGEEVLKAYGFDAANQMSSSMGRTDGTIQKAVYQYNGLGHRMGQSIATGDAAPARTIRYTLDLTRQYHNLLQKTGNGPDQTYFWDGNVAGMEEEGRDHFYFQDDLGSPMRLTDETGRSEEAYGFDEFGNNIRTAKDIFQDSMQSFGFTGYQMDGAGGLYFAQARRYDAGAGRFVSEDILKGHIAVPYTMNHYNYCWNRPMDLVDLNGKFPSWRDLKKFWNKYIYGEETIGSSTNTVVTGKNWGMGTYHSEVYDITKTSDKYTGSWIKNVTTLGNDGNSQSYSLNIPSADLGKGNKFGIPTSLGVTFSNGGVSLDANIGIDLGKLNVNIPISIGLNWDNLVSVDASLNGGWADNSYGLDLSAGLHPGSNVKLGVHEKHAVDEKTTIKTENGVYMRMGYVYVVVIAAAALGSMLYGNDPSSAGQTIINFINNFVNNGVCPALQ
ncbi:RHS repeat-associated core domain-containing protein, partial [Agathobacter rectalis]